MIVGIGIDIIELARMKDTIENQPRFATRILTEKEQSKFQTLTPKRKIEYLAGRFAAKEAYSKAKGTGIGQGVSFQDIEILSDELGKPMITVVGEKNKIHVSISHSNEYAVAQVILES